MNQFSIASKIIYTNLKYFGIDVLSLYKESAKEISEKLIHKFGKNKTYSIICGLGGNGGDGFALASELNKNKVSKVKVFLVGRGNQIQNPVSKELFDEIYNLKSENLQIYQDCYADDVEQGDINIECLVGTGLEGEKLHKRFHDVIKRVSHFTNPLIALDAPAPSYTPDFVHSLLYPKTPDAEIISVNIPLDVSLYCGPGEVQALFVPKRHTHKQKNGRLLVIEDKTNNDIISLTASQYEVEASFYNINQNNKSIDEQFEFEIESHDVILIRDIEDKTFKTKAFINYLLTKYPRKKFILTGNTLDLIDMDNLSSLSDCLIIPERNNIENIVNEKINVSNMEGVLRRYSKERNKNFLVIGSNILLFYNNGDFKLDKANLNYLPELKDVLIALASSFYTKNDLWLSMRASTFIVNRLGILINDPEYKGDIEKVIKKIPEIIELCREL